MSMIPIRCFSCNKVIANKWIMYNNHLDSGMNANNAFAEVGIYRYCCKRMFLGHVDIIDKLLLYQENKDNDYNEKSGIK